MATQRGSFYNVGYTYTQDEFNALLRELAAREDLARRDLSNLQTTYGFDPGGTGSWGSPDEFRDADGTIYRAVYVDPATGRPRDRYVDGPEGPLESGAQLGYYETILDQGGPGQGYNTFRLDPSMGVRDNQDWLLAAQYNPDGTLREITPRERMQTSTWQAIRPALAMAGLAAGGGWLANALQGAGSGAGAGAGAGGAAGGAPAIGGSLAPADLIAGAGANGLAGPTLTSGAGGLLGAGTGAAAIGGSLAPADLIAGTGANGLAGPTLTSGAGGTLPAAAGAGGILGQIAGGAGAVSDFLSNNPWAMPLLGAGLGALAGTEDQTLTTTVRPSQEYLDAVAPQIDRINQYASSQGPAFGGSFDTTDPNQGKMLGLLDQATTRADATINPYATANNPYTQAMIRAANDELTRAYNNNIQPKFASGSSFGNSGLAFAEVDALNDLTKNLSNQTNQLLWQDYARAGDLSESFAGRQDTLTRDANNNALSGAGILGQYGIAGRQLDQRAREMDWNEFTRQQDENYRRIAAGNGLFNLDLGRTQTQVAPGNVWASALGGGILGGQAAGLFDGNLFGKKK